MIDATDRAGYADDENIAMPKKSENETFRVMLGVRLTQEDADRLDALRRRIRIASRHAIAREAFRIGLAELERHPMILVGEEPPKGSKAGGAPKRAARPPRPRPRP